LAGLHAQELRRAQRCRKFCGHFVSRCRESRDQMRGTSGAIGRGMRQLEIRDYMTPSPLTIAPTESMASAFTLMKANHIRHLPVLDGTVLVGLVSERDLHLINSLPDVDPNKVPVSEAMSTHVYSISPGSSLEWVATEMGARRIGSAIVVEDGQVVGVFTTVDALRSLSELLAEARREAFHSEVRP
jgi:acetoin utilization protein AcuB